MNPFRFRLPILCPLLSLALVATAFAEKPAAPAKPASPPSALELEAGDTLVFLGDSITHQCLYTQYVEDFYYTRYPDRKLRFHNAGVSGDRASDALARFEEDVAKLKPAAVTILLGMNDGEYADFRADTFSTYSAGMAKILDRIAALGARPVAMSPTMFDHHQLAIQMQNPDYRFRERTFSGQYNFLLAFYGGWLREESGARGLAYADLWGPMNELVFARRRTEGDFTLVPDAIHPAPAGQFLMAFELLEQVTPARRSVGSIQIVPAQKGFRATSSGGQVSDLEVSEAKDRVAFSHLAVSLPWVVPADAYGIPQNRDAEPAAPLAVQMTAAGHKLSNERLRVAGLAPGTYEVRIDGEPVGRYGHLALGSKIELQGNAATPQHRQALDVANLNRERNDLAVRPLRDAWGSVKGIRKKTGDDAAAFEEQTQAQRKKIGELVQLARDYEDRIHAAAAPQLRHYEIVRVP